MRRHSQLIALPQKDHCVIGVAKVDRRLHERVQHGLQVECGPADDLEYFSRCGLLLKQFALLVIARLQVGEQAHIVHGDRGLVGKNLQKLHLVWRKLSGLCAGHDNCRDRLAVANDRHADQAAVPAAYRDMRGVFGIFQVIFYLFHRATDNATARNVAPNRRGGKHCRDRGDGFSLPPIMRDEVDQFPVEAEKVAEGGVTQACGALRDRIEDGLGIGWRSRYDPQDLCRRRLLFKCVGNFLVSCLQVSQDTRILDGERGLVCESAYKAYFFIAERLHAFAVNCDRTKHFFVLQDRHGENGARSTQFDGCPAYFLIFWPNFSIEVGDLGRMARDNCATCRCALPKTVRSSLEAFFILLRHVAQGRRKESFRRTAEKDSVLGSAQCNSLLQDHVENGRKRSGGTR